MSVRKKMKSTHSFESYWDMLPPEIKEMILQYKESQEAIDEERKERMREVCDEIVMYKELKDKWALGHIRCVVKKKIFCQRYTEIMGCYFDFEENVNRTRFLGYDFKSALQRINHVKSFM